MSKKISRDILRGFTLDNSVQAYSKLITIFAVIKEMVKFGQRGWMNG